ncbi:MAG: LysM peptidoglycan-binding domain-containing protein [Bacteroidia bacterium]|nr:LysM peptidoglycan-binding domain-containing protein [Bacteroidia bacterium]
MSSNLLAQDIKRSKKIETIEGKKYYIHTVEKGQTLYAIAHAYELKVNDIVIENPDAIDGIKPGQNLKIPLPKEKSKTELFTKSDSAKYHFHHVQQGETMYSLSKTYSLSIDDLKKINPELKDGLKINQVVKIPIGKLQSKNKTDREEKTSEKEKLKEKKSENQPHIISNPQLPRADVQKASEYEPENSNTLPEHTVLKTDTSNRLNNFNIALFLPFHLSETNDLDVAKVVQGDATIPISTEIAIAFYQGAQLALDSLKKTGLNAKLFVYDVNENDSMPLPEILKKNELHKMDLIVGPLYSSNFVPFSKYAKENQIFISSPLSQQNKILFNNPYVSKVTASQTTQAERMAEYVAEKCKGQTIVVINSGNPKDASLTKLFMNKANSLLLKSGADSVKELKGFTGIEKYIRPEKTTAVIVPSNNKSFVTDFITKLNPLREKNPIVLYGMQSWSDFDNLDIDYLNKLQVHYPSPTFIDYDNEQVKMFVRKYAAQYKTTPSEYVFHGFDVFYFYTDMMRKYGINFQSKLASVKQKGLQTSFEFYQVLPDSGFENKAVYMLMYQDYKLVKAD